MQKNKKNLFKKNLKSKNCIGNNKLCSNVTVKQNVLLHLI